MRQQPRRRIDERGQAGQMVAVVVGLAVLIGAVGALVIFAALRSDNDEVEGMYISLGDSIAFGTGASDSARFGFAALLAEREGVALFNMAVDGAAAEDVADAQVARALPAIEEGDVRFVTIVAGGNNLAVLIPNEACVQDPLPEECPLAEVLAAVEENLRRALDQLRGADAGVPIVLLAYPNLFSGTGHMWEEPAGRVLPELNEVIRRVAGDYERVAVAEAEAAFEGRGAALTGVLLEPFEPHPNDSGHAAIADAFHEALGEARGE